MTIVGCGFGKCGTVTECLDCGRAPGKAPTTRVTYKYKCTVCGYVDAYWTELPEALRGRCHQPNIDRCPGNLEKVES